jgi:hypothetical protein
LSVVGVVPGLVFRFGGAILLEFFLCASILPTDVLRMTRVVAKCAGSGGSGQSAANRRRLFLATFSLVVLTYKRVLNCSLVQVVLEQKGRDKRVVVVRKGAYKRHGAEFIVQLVQSEASRPQITNAVYSVIYTVDKRLEILLIPFPDGKQVIVCVEACTRPFLHVNGFQSIPHLHCIILDPPEVHPLHRFNHEIHNASCLVCLDLPCFEFVLLPILERCTECRGLGSARDDAPEGLSTIPSLHITIPRSVVVGAEFVKGWD